MGRINEVLRLLFLQVKGQLDARYGCFEILACDFLLREDLTPVLMEVNSNASYSFEMDDSRDFMKTLLRDVITLSSDLHESNKKKATPEFLARVF